MQPDRKQSFIQWLNEPTGWLSSDLALDRRVSLGGTAPHSSSQPLALSCRGALSGRGRTDVPAAGTSTVRQVTGRVCTRTACFQLAKCSPNGNIQTMPGLQPGSERGAGAAEASGEMKTAG